MKRNILISTLALFAMIAQSCTPEPSGPNCGTIQYSWKANGVYYEGSADSHFDPSFGLHSYFFSGCTNGNSPTLTIKLHVPLQTGTYTMYNVNDADYPYQGYASYLDGSGSSYYDTDSTYTGSVVLTTVAPDSAITGTFSFNLLHSTSSATINITEGQFTAIPQ